MATALKSAVLLDTFPKAAVDVYACVLEVCKQLHITQCTLLMRSHIQCSALPYWTERIPPRLRANSRTVCLAASHLGRSISDTYPLERHRGQCPASFMSGSIPYALHCQPIVRAQAGGGELPAVICAASLALADAGVAMRDLVAACAVVRHTRWQNN